MPYVLIDTNCWIDLLANEAEEKGLRILEHCVKEKQIVLLVPERLKEEWQRQKNDHLNKMRESINLGLKGFESATQRRLKLEIHRREAKAERIETLLNGGKGCPTTQAVHLEVTKRRAKRLAPFHKMPNSDGDAYIYCSATTYSKTRRLGSLIFITHDKKAFSQVGDDNKLHPDLLVNGLTIEYLYGVGPGTNWLKKQFGIQDDRANSNADFEDIFYLFNDEKKLPIADRIYKALDAYYDQLPFIPTNLLAKVYPFKIENIQTGYTYPSSFQINTNNEAVAQFFANIEVGDKNEIKFVNDQGNKTSKQKAFSIFHRLNQNLIFTISAIASNTELDIRLKKDLEKTIQDRFNEFDFLKAHQMLRSKPSKDTRETLRQGYLQFQFGYFEEAMDLFYAVYERSKSNGKRLLEFVALYNLKRIKNFITSYYLSQTEKTASIIKKIDRVSISKYRVTYEQEPGFVQDCMAWIADNDFHQETFSELSETVEAIRDHWHTQLGAGVSSNSNYEKLLSRYLELDQFLEMNCIVFNTYSNYEQITAKLAEGLLMMHTFNNKQPGRVKSIDSILLQKLLLYAKRETLVKHYKRLHLTAVGEDETAGIKNVLKTAERFFGDHQKLREALLKTQDQNPFFFWDKYHKVAGNLLLLVTVSPSTADHTPLAKKMMDAMTDDNLSRRLETAHLADFIRLKGKYIQTNVLKKFMSFAIENSKFHDNSFFGAFNKQRRHDHPALLIKDKNEVQKIETYFFQECPKCNSLHDPSLAGEAYLLLAEPYKGQLQKSVVKRLAERFNTGLYYTLAMYEVIDYRLFFDAYAESCPVLNGGKPKHSFFGDPEANHPRLSQLLNLAFKFNIDFQNDVRFQKHKGTSPYYDWLLNMDAFGYSAFDPLWILAYQTDVHLKKIFSSAKVIANLLPYLKKTKHPVLSDLLIQYGWKSDV